MLPAFTGISSAQAKSPASGARTGLLALVKDVIDTCARAHAAAHYYEELRPMSDQALADRGLTRAGLARAAFMKLSERW
jgi:hypothetical protein